MKSSAFRNCVPHLKMCSAWFRISSALPFRVLSDSSAFRKFPHFSNEFRFHTRLFFSDCSATLLRSFEMTSVFLIVPHSAIVICMFWNMFRFHIPHLSDSSAVLNCVPHDFEFVPHPSFFDFPILQLYSAPLKMNSAFTFRVLWDSSAFRNCVPHYWKWVPLPHFSDSSSFRNSVPHI